ncbi:hypothetical protein G6F32_016827 [Rhizopus arrhizus]|nr:hypothetical protein G6F32_016827 [Rhizopus arrhizus]
MGRLRQRQAIAQQHPRPRHPPIAQPGLRRQAVAAGKLLDERRAMAVLRLRQRFQIRRAGRIGGHAFAQQGADVGRIGQGGVAGAGMRSQQPE